MKGRCTSIYLHWRFRKQVTNSMDLPLVSVVMPSFNQAQYIRTSIESVLQQNYPSLELIVADGGSSDDSVHILEQLSRNDCRVRWFSRRDRGPAHALNDAMALVRGTTIGWLNSDDLYATGAISRAMAALLEQPNLLMVYGNGQHIDGNGGMLGHYPSLPPSATLQRFAQGCYICQPTMFFQRSARVLLGQLNENLKAAFDFEYWLRAFSSFPDRIGFIDDIQAYSRLHEDCITLRMRKTVALEGMQVLARYLGHAPKEWFLTYVDEAFQQSSTDSNNELLREEILIALEVAQTYVATDHKQALRTAVENRIQAKMRASHQYE